MMIKKYPFVSQTGIKDCGVACLKMIIKYYDGYIGTVQLQGMTKTDKSGTTAYHLIEALKQIGFEAYGVKASISDINEKNMILPCIANVTIDNTYNHYIVIYEINYKKRTLLIADPAKKIYKISFTEFEKIWNNVFLFMYPIKKIPLYTNEHSQLKFLLNILSINKKILINTVLISILYSIYSVIGSYYFKFVGDALIINNSTNFLVTIFIIFFVMLLFKLLSNYFRNQLLLYLNEKIEASLTNGIYKKIIFLPYNYYRNHTTGEIVSRLNDLSKIREMINKIIVFLFIDLPLSIVSFIILYLISKELFIVSLVILILYILTTLILIPILKHHIEICEQKKVEQNSYMTETINGFESIKGIGIENLVIKKFNNKLINFLNKLFNFETSFNKQYLLKEAICDIGLILIIFIGSLLIVEEKLTIGGLLLFNSLFSYFILPFKNTLELGILIMESKVTLKRILEITEYKIDDGFLEKDMVGNIMVQNLKYSYDSINPILENINLNINMGEKIMVVGKSGSGKSTLFKLIMKYYNLDRNQIKIDNIDINDYKDICIKNNIVYISQNETLFTDTLYNNINLNNGSNEKFLEIANMCYIDEIIKNKNTGFYTLVEENGFNFSGGERQRIVLARSLMKDFKILIIDEGLNQVDIDLERKILKNILTKYKDKTIIVVSHRMDNIDLFNRVIEFSNHKIIKDECK